MLDVKMTTRGRPSVSCKLSAGGCGWSGFVNAKKGVSMWTGDPAPAAIAAAPADAPPEKTKADPPPVTPEGGGRGFKFAWEK